MSKPMHHLNIGNESYEVVDSTARNATDVLTGQIDGLIVDNTTNASGWKVVTTQQTVTKDEDNTVYNFSDLPEDFVLLEACYSDTTVAGFRETDGLRTVVFHTLAGDGVTFSVPSANVATTSVIFYLTYAYPDSVDLSELTDIRIGADGTTYETAGESVRSQVQLAMAASQSSGSGLTDAMKEALMNIVNHIAYWTDSHAPDYIAALEAALYPSYSVTYNLTDVTSDNDETEVTDGDAFTAELTPASGLYITHIVVTMGGVDITNSAFTPNS